MQTRRGITYSHRGSRARNRTRPPQEVCDMMTLYYRKDCPTCGSLRDALEGLAVKSRVVELEPDAPLPEQLPADADLPALTDDGQTYAGAEAVARHLDEMKVFREWWYKFQSDACYCDEEGDVITGDGGH